MTSKIGSISISACLNCEKVFSLADQLTKTMQEFEIFTLEMEFDPKSAKAKSREVLSHFWQLISTIKSFKTLEKDNLFDNQKALCETSNSNSSQSSSKSKSSVVLRLEQRPIESEEQEEESEEELLESQSKSNGVAKRNRTRKPNPKRKLKPKPIMTPQRLEELEQANTLLRTVKCETRHGFYNLFECIRCERQFNDKYSGVRHVQIVHLKLGNRCSTCRQKFFNKKSLELHIPNCSKQEQLKQIKGKAPVYLQKNRKNPVKVHLQPNKKPNQEQQKQKASSIRIQNRNRNRNQRQKQNEEEDESPSPRDRNPNQSQFGYDNFIRKIPTQRLENPKTSSGSSKIKVSNPCQDFNLEKALNVKVGMERLKVKNSGEISYAVENRKSEKIQNKPKK